MSRAEVARAAALASLYSFSLATSNCFVSACVVWAAPLNVLLSFAQFEREVTAESTSAGRERSV